MRRWDVRAWDGILTDDAGRLAMFWTKRAAFNRAAFINANAACRGVSARCYVVDRRTGERYYADDAWQVTFPEITETRTVSQFIADTIRNPA